MPRGYPTGTLSVGSLKLESQRKRTCHCDFVVDFSSRYLDSVKLMTATEDKE